MLYQILQFILLLFKMNFSFLKMLNLNQQLFYYHLMLINLENFHEMMTFYYLIQFSIQKLINPFILIHHLIFLFSLTIIICQISIFLKI